MTALRTVLVGGLCVLGSGAFAQRISLGGAQGPVLKTEVSARNSGGLNPVRVSIGLSHIDVEKTREGFQDIRVPGLMNLEQAGSPNMPTTGALIAVPAGYTAKLVVESEDTQVVPGVIPAPAQKTMRCPGTEGTTFAFNRAAYAPGSTFPANRIQLETMGNLRGLQLVRIAVSPTQWVADREELVVTRSLEARVEFVKTGAATNTVLPRSMQELIAKSTVNGSSLMNRVANDKLLILVADELAGAITPYVDWKRSKGLEVAVVTATEAGSTKEKIRDYVKAAYSSNGRQISSILFVGNNTTMPGFMESTASGSAATDYTYALLAGDDEVPDVTYGRVIADSVAEATTQVNRWINYERNPSTLEKAMGIASNEGSGPSDEDYANEIRDVMMKKGLTHVDQFYEGDDNATVKNITEALSEGRSWISYFGHGTGTSWASTNDMFNNAAVAKQTNVGKLPVIIDVACQNASWVKIAKCFGKAWVTQESEGAPAGAVAFYGGSVNISWHPPAIMSVGVAKAHFENGVNTLGAAVLGGQLYLLEQKGKSEDTIDNLRWYNLFGDPMMQISAN